MEVFREWAAALCGTAVLCCAVNLVVPENKNSKMMRIVLALVMMCVLVSPLHAIGDIRLNFGNTIKQTAQTGERLLNTVEQQTCEKIRSSLTDLIENELHAADIVPEKIFIDMDISDDGCISIGQVTVTVRESSADQCGRIKEMLKQRLGLETEARAGG